jgi:hypothetical protein
MQWEQIIDRLRSRGIKFAKGLSPEEISSAEAHYNIQFPEDYRAFLSLALPVSSGFPNWRNFSDSLDSSIKWPWKGMAFDIEHDSYWQTTWGIRPDTLADALQIAKEHFDQVPKLIPVYGHRYISCEPKDAGNPIFSVYQMDIIYYGSTLAEYFEIDFFGLDHSEMSQNIRPIRFWGEAVEENGKFDSESD